jgi:heme O synthase-like polyprenyltransferase
MYPISYEADFNPTPNRWTTFFRLLLAIPWFVVATFWSIVFYVTLFLAWLLVTILGRYPEWLYKVNAGIVRFTVRFSAWVYLQTDQWPPFGLSDDPNYPIRVNFAPPASRQSRLKAFFRHLLALPVFFVLSYGTAYITLLVGFVAWLTIVFRGYLPQWNNDALTALHGFQARVLGYLAILTDDYPPIGLEAARQDGAAPPAAPLPPQPPATPTV